MPTSDENSGAHQPFEYDNSAPMSDKEASDTTLVGFELLMSQARIIAMLPLEDWLTAFERAETIGPFIDPTLYREYQQDPQRRGEVIKGIISAALPLKKEVLKWQEVVKNAQRNK